MKLKVSDWGNSHGLRLSTAMMDHLQIKSGDEVSLNLTNNGLEILKNRQHLNYLNSVKSELQKLINQQTRPVSKVHDPYEETDIAYVVFPIDPCAPLIREVPAGTENSYKTLADAKEVARQHIQKSIADAQKSLSDLRQLGIDTIKYIEL